jgi:hypothetical protein
MPDFILIQDASGTWQRAAESDLPDEATLQQLIRDHPEVLPFDDLGDTVPPLLVVGRETALATGYADVVAVDPDGLVTIIEAKLDRNPEVKRKVVAQVLGYAASLWGFDYERFDREVARKYFTGSNCHSPAVRDLGLDDAMTAFVEERGLTEAWDKLAFRDALADNLRAGRFRLVIVVDKVNDELRRIVEYLNACTQPGFQILCAELRYFSTGSMRLLVPALIGAPKAQQTAAKGLSRQWDEQGFLAKIERSNGLAARMTVEQILQWAWSTVDRVNWGLAPKGGFTARLIFREDVGPTLIAVYSYAKVEVSFAYLRQYPPYDELTQREALRDRLNAIPGIALPESSVNGQPAFPIEVLASQDTLTAFLEVMSSVVSDLRQHRDQWLSRSEK